MSPNNDIFIQNHNFIILENLYIYLKMPSNRNFKFKFLQLFEKYFKFVFLKFGLKLGLFSTFYFQILLVFLIYLCAFHAMVIFIEFKTVTVNYRAVQDNPCQILGILLMFFFHD